jgi:glycerol-3-phosphate acyltransferase PlsY
MLVALNTLAFTLLAYGLGSIPFGVIFGYLFTGRDIRAGGSGRAGGTNTIRQAGWKAGLLAVFGDVAKGLLAVWLAQRYGAHWLAPALAAAAVTAGHCWPLFAGFRGGMGLATGGGVLLMVYPLGFLAAFAALLAAAFILRQPVRAALAACVIGLPIVWLLSQDAEVSSIAAGLAGVVAARALPDWNERRRESMWLGDVKRDA